MIKLNNSFFTYTNLSTKENFENITHFNKKYAKGYMTTYNINNNFVIQKFKGTFNNESLLELNTHFNYSLVLYITGSGDEFFPYQNISPNTLRAYHPHNKYKVIYHSKIELNCIQIVFKPYFIDNFIKENFPDKASEIKNFFKNKNKLYIPHINKLFYDMYNYSETSNPNIFFTAKVYEILSEIYKFIKTKNNNYKLSNEDIIALNEITNYINEHYNQNISLEILAKIAFMSESKLKKIFKIFHNMSITEYLQRKRISIAEHMLINTNLSIKEISNLVGYTNSSRFSELFKRYYNILPNNYRKHL